MRARQRLLLDIVIAVGLIAAYRPTWTGISLHQWISVAIIVPLAVHLVVNWDWAVRIAKTFLDRLFHTSRANFVVDAGLLVSSVAVMVSGVMVSPVPAFFGATVAQPLVWSMLHAWSANAIIALFAVHAILHWRWVVATVKRLAAERPAPATAPARAGSSRRRLTPAAAPASAVARDLTPSQMRRAVRLAAEKAAAKRRAAVAGVVTVSLALGSLLFASVALAGPAISRRLSRELTASAPAVTAHAAAPAPTSATPASPKATATKAASKPKAAAPVAAAPAPKAAAVKQYCPRTGCAAITCHGASGASPGAWYRTHN